MAGLERPQILLASDLAHGDVVFLGASGWERDCHRAKIVYDSDAAAALQAFGQAEIAKNHVVDVYLVDVAVDASGAPEPLHYREKIRALGPSVRRDLGKQAWLRRSGDAM